MTDRTGSTEVTHTTVPEPKPRYRLTSRRKRATEELAEPTSPVQRPSRVVFDASPATVAASLLKTGNTGVEATLSWPAMAEAHAPAEDSPPAETVPPVFVIGGGESERKLLHGLLDAHPNLRCGADGQQLAAMAEAVKESWETTLVYQGYPEQYWFRYVAKHFNSMQMSKAAEHNKSRWVEFIADGALSVDTLDRMFPTSRIVHLVSTGWSSPRRRRAVRASAARISAGRYLEVRASDLTVDPDGAVRRILRFLDESPQSFDAA
jgi:hypothetical protein